MYCDFDSEVSAQRELAHMLYQVGLPHMFERRPSPRSVLLPVLWEGPAKPLAGSVLVFTKDQWG